MYFTGTKLVDEYVYAIWYNVLQDMCPTPLRDDENNVVSYHSLSYMSLVKGSWKLFSQKKEPVGTLCVFIKCMTTLSRLFWPNWLYMSNKVYNLSNVFYQWRGYFIKFFWRVLFSFKHWIFKKRFDGKTLYYFWTL